MPAFVRVVIIAGGETNYEIACTSGQTDVTAGRYEKCGWISKAGLVADVVSCSKKCLDLARAACRWYTAVFQGLHPKLGSPFFGGLGMAFDLTGKEEILHPLQPQLPHHDESSFVGIFVPVRNLDV